MWLFNSIFGKIFDILFLPFRTMSPWVALVLISLLTGIFMLLVFRWTSNQAGIKAIKNRIKAHLLEIRLFKDNLGLSLKAQGNILKCNIKYISYSAKPMLFMILPLALILIQMNLWFGYNPISPERPILFKVILKAEYDPIETDIRINSTSPGLTVETLPLRIEETREIDWRFSIKTPGIHTIELEVDGERIQKTIDATKDVLRRISPVTVQRNVFKEILNPGEKSLPASSPIQSIEVCYPARMMDLFGWRIHWIIAFFGLSIIFGFSLKNLFGVDI